LFSAESLQPGGAVQRLLDDSKRFSASLAVSLRERIYDSMVPKLAQAVVEARGLKNPSVTDLDLTYRMALTVLFRLLFVAYAEDRDLLPYKISEPYRSHSLKHKAQELAEHFRIETPIPTGASHWDEVSLVWNAIEHGDAHLSVPAYDGGLSSSADGATATATRSRSFSRVGARKLGIIAAYLCRAVDARSSDAPSHMESCGAGRLDGKDTRLRGLEGRRAALQQLVDRVEGVVFSEAIKAAGALAWP
jgi:hypothetical protein